MKNNAFERTMLVLIFIAIVCVIILLPGKPESTPYGHFRYLPYNPGDTTATGGTGGIKGDPKKRIDTLLIYPSLTSKGTANPDSCPCCPKVYMLYSLTSTDSTHGGTGGPHFFSMVELTSTDTTNDKKGIKGKLDPGQ